MGKTGRCQTREREEGGRNRENGGHEGKMKDSKEKMMETEGEHGRTKEI